MAVEPDNPTVILAAGDAGYQMLSRISEILEDENYDREKFMLLAVDSSSIDNIKEIDRFRENKTTLDTPADWGYKQQKYEYLTKKDGNPSASGGVRRNRNAGRAVIEDEPNLNEVQNWLETRLDTFAGFEDGIDIWLVNGLGGGTGSSIMPMLMGLLRVVIERNQITADVFALSTVPKLDAKADSEFDPGFNTRTVPNAFAALAELEPILDETSHYSSPEQAIDLQFETGAVDGLRDSQDELEITRPFIREYYLLGVNEERLNQQMETYEEEVEKTAAFTILAKAVKDENFPGDYIDTHAERTLRSCDLTERGFPYQDASRYIRQEIDLRNLKNDRERLRELVSRAEDENTTGLLEEHERIVDRAKNVRSSAENIGNQALKAAFDGTKTSFGDGEIDMYLRWSELQNARTKIEDDGQNRIDIDKSDYNELRSTFDGVEDIRDQITHDGFRPELPGEYLKESDDDSVVLPSRYVIEYLYFVAVRLEVWERVKERRDEFENAQENLYEHDQVRPKMDQQQRDEFNNAANASERWEDVLSDFIDDRADYLNEKRDFYPLTDLDELAAELRTKKRNVENKKADYEEWKELHRILNEIVAGKQSVLRDLSKNYEEWQDSIRDDIERIDDKIDQVTTRQENVQTGLQESSSTQEKFKKFRIESPEELIVDYFQTDGKSLLERVEELKDEYGTADATDPDKEAIRRHLRNELTIQDLASGETVDRKEIYDDVTEALELTKKRVTKKGTGSDGVLIPISHPKDDWLEALGSESYAQWAAAADRMSADFAKQDGSQNEDASGGKRGYLRFLFVNPDVTLDNTYIYDSMKTWYEDDKLLNMMDSAEDDVEEAVNWAYPELAQHILTSSLPADRDNPT